VRVVASKLGKEPAHCALTLQAGTWCKQPNTVTVTDQRCSVDASTC
jgi:hypothetical protein